MIRYLIIDDEHITHDIIKRYCDLLPHMRLVKNCYDALEAIEFINNNEVDLIFLDLNLPVLTGFEFLKTLKHRPKVIVVTAYQEFALEGYEYNIVDYLLKPFGFERFLKAINLVSSVENQKHGMDSIENIGISDRIFLQSNGKHVQLDIGSVHFIEATGNYTKFVTAVDTLVVRKKFTTSLELLPKSDFIQVHKSFAVAKKYIQSIEGNQICIANYKIPIGKLYKFNIVQLLK